MTLKEVATKKIKRIRVEPWNKWAYVELNYNGNNLTPFAHSWDIGCPGTETLMLHTLEEETRWEEWTEPKDYEECKGEIYITFDKLLSH